MVLYYENKSYVLNFLAVKFCTDNFATNYNLSISYQDCIPVVDFYCAIESDIKAIVQQARALRYQLG